MFYRQLLLSTYAIFKQLLAPEKAVHIEMVHGTCMYI